MPKIDEIEFSKLVSNGKVYRAACLVFPDSVDGRWWRKNGLEYNLDDFESVVSFEPDFLILGLGFMNALSVDDRLIKYCEEQRIDCKSFPTKEAVEQFNELLDQKKKVVGAFHLI